jgi:arylsulfatase A-like enzyme
VRHLARAAFVAFLLSATLAASRCERGPVFEQRSVRLDLIELFPVAQVSRQLEEIRFLDPAQQRLLSSGWTRPQPDGGGFAWTRGRDAVVEVPVVRPQPLEVSLELGASVAPGPLPPQELRILWNGQPVGSVSPGPAPASSGAIRVGAELQRIGPNRLDLLPRYWEGRASEARGNGDQGRGVQVRGIRIDRSRPEARVAGPAARAGDAALTQAPGGVVSYYVVLPEAARLCGRVELDRGSPEPSEALPGRVALSLVDSAGEDHMLAKWPLRALAGNPEAAFDIDLSAHAGSMVALSLSVSVPRSTLREPAPAALPAVRWHELRIEGYTEDPVEEAAERFRGSFNVLLILFDTLRADHTDPYGAESVSTPALAQLARRGVTFVNASANASWTRSSVASLLTALHPVAHRVATGRSALPQSVPYLPSLLKRAGYATLGVVNNPQITLGSGFARDFDALVDYRALRPLASGTRAPEEHAQAVWQGFVEPFIAGTAGGRFFVYLHELDPHAPYEPPPPFDTVHDFGYQGNVTTSGSSARERVRLLSLLDRGEAWLGEADIRHLRSQYAGEVAFMDRFLGWILTRLEELGLAQETLVVFVSDHGEEFLEHGSWGHGASVYQTVLEVPMILSLPGVLPEGRRPRFHAQLHDLAPTILDLLGLEASPKMQGRSLLPLLATDDDHEPGRATFGRSLHRLRGPGRTLVGVDSVRFGDWKLLRHSRGKGDQLLQSFELFDLGDDPGERIDRWPTEPVVGHTLRQMLEWHDHEGPRRVVAAPRTAEIDAETEQALRELGYFR